MTGGQALAHDAIVCAPLDPGAGEGIIAAEVRKYCADHLDERRIQELIAECMIGLRKGITHHDITELITLALRSRVEWDPVYSFLAARCRTSMITLGSLDACPGWVIFRGQEACADTPG
ncbi:MAG: hypothetical protein ACRD0K_02615 [Egibacteraceae bacterium]